jgi:hypothetical protein
MKVNIDVEVNDGVPAEQVAGMLDRVIKSVSGGTYGYDGERGNYGYSLGTTVGDSGHAVEGEPYRAPTGGIEVRLFGASNPESAA